MRVKLLRRSITTFGKYNPGAFVDLPTEEALAMLRNGVAIVPPPPQVTYETKVIVPEPKEAGFKSGHFRFVHLFDALKAAMVEARHHMFSAANSHKIRTDHPRRRRR